MWDRVCGCAITSADMAWDRVLLRVLLRRLRGTVYEAEARPVLLARLQGGSTP